MTDAKVANPITHKTEKYSGADWLASILRRRNREVSPLGRKVADILGQVHQGIYHVDDDVLNHKVQWHDATRIDITFYGCFSTYDDPKLTLLLICCVASGVMFTIRGRTKSYYRLSFLPDTSGRTIADIVQDSQQDDIWTLLARLPESRELEHGMSSLSRPYLRGRCDHLSFDQVIALVQAAHTNAIRAQLTGLSPSSLEVYLHQRQRDGDLYLRHPTLEQAIEMWSPYWGVFS